MNATNSNYNLSNIPPVTVQVSVMNKARKIQQETTSELLADTISRINQQHQNQIFQEYA